MMGGGSLTQRGSGVGRSGHKWLLTMLAEQMALNDALAGEILSCGRGDMLNITMLDREGNASEFPPLKSGTRECSSQWKSSVTISTRIYVRHGH
eukprot:1146642-Pelagomonas_calceolata.AAC.1